MPIAFWLVCDNSRQSLKVGDTKTGELNHVPSFLCISIYVIPSTSSGFPSASTSLRLPSLGIISMLCSLAMLDLKMSIVAPVAGRVTIFINLPSLLHRRSTFTVGVFSPLHLQMGFDIFPFEDILAMMSKSAVRAMFPCLHMVDDFLTSASELDEV